VPQFCGDGTCNDNEDELTCGDCPASNLNVYLANEQEIYKDASLYGCSPKLWTINNSKINLSLSYNAYISSSSDCSLIGSAILNDGFPMRLRDFVSNSGYRINQVFPNATKFCGYIYLSAYCNNYLAQINSSSPQNYTILPNGMLFKFISSGNPNLIGNISYRMTNNSNYVRIDAIWKNNGGTDITDFQPALEWNQNHPPHGYYRSDDGDYVSTSANPTGNTNSLKWLAFWSSDYGDDLIGWIVNSQTERVRRIGSGPRVLIFKQTISTLYAGSNYTMTFYIMSDQRGSAGNEWVPVNQTYCNIFWNTTYCGATK